MLLVRVDEEDEAFGHKREKEGGGRGVRSGEQGTYTYIWEVGIDESLRGMMTEFTNGTKNYCNKQSEKIAKRRDEKNPSTARI